MREIERRLTAIEQQAARDRRPVDQEPIPAGDADLLDDDEVLQEACWAMSRGILSFNLWAADPAHRSRLSPCSGAPKYSPTYWRRVGERADALRAERGTVLIAADVDTLTEVLRLLDTGELSVKPPWREAHACWFRPGENVPAGDPRWPALRALERVLDGLHLQTGMPICRSVSEARAALREVLMLLQGIGDVQNN